MAKLNIYNDKLTPSAREALSDILVELQDMLLDRANLIAQKGETADKEISLRDILEARDNLLRVKIERDKSDIRRKRLMTMFSLTGALYSILGVLFYLYQNNSFSIEKDLGIIIVFAGILTIIVGYTYTQLLYRRQEENKKELGIGFRAIDDDFEIIKRWQIIEKLGSNLMRQNGYTTNESKSINDILKFLSLELKSDKLFLEMRELLSVRNKILHESYEPSRQEKREYIDKANNIINLLEKLEK